MFPADTKILVVDDMKGVRIFVMKMLQKLGFTNLCEAGNGKEAVAVVEEGLGKGEPVGIVFADMRMPDMDGLEFLKFVRSKPQTQNIPFVMLSAESDKDSVVQALRLGVDDYLVKPATEQMMREKLSNLYREKGRKAQ